MMNADRRIARERRTVAAMLRLYCRDLHDSDQELCAGCQSLQDYAWQRLDKCPYQEGKTTCAKCPIHCYKTDMRAQVRQVMRYAGPRMLYRHPVMAVRHLLDGLRQQPTHRLVTRGGRARP